MPYFMYFSPSWGGSGMLTDLTARCITPRGSGTHVEPTVLLKGNVVLHKGLKVLPLLHHVIHRLLSVPEMVP